MRSDDVLQDNQSYRSSSWAQFLVTVLVAFFVFMFPSHPGLPTCQGVAKTGSKEHQPARNSQMRGWKPGQIWGCEKGRHIIQEPFFDCLTISSPSLYHLAGVSPSQVPPWNGTDEAMDCLRKGPSVHDLLWKQIQGELEGGGGSGKLGGDRSSGGGSGGENGGFSVDWNELLQIILATFSFTLLVIRLYFFNSSICSLLRSDSK